MRAEASNEDESTDEKGSVMRMQVAVRKEVKSVAEGAHGLKRGPHLSVKRERERERASGCLNHKKGHEKIEKSQKGQGKNIQVTLRERDREREIEREKGCIRSISGRRTHENSTHTGRRISIVE